MRRVIHMLLALTALLLLGCSSGVREQDIEATAAGQVGATISARSVEGQEVAVTPVSTPEATATQSVMATPTSVPRSPAPAPVTPQGPPQVPASCMPIPTQMASTEAATLSEHYRNIGYNKPYDGMAQEIVVASDVPQEVVDEWCEIQRNLNETIGSYNRFIMLITTDDEHSQAVFDKLKEVHWYGPLRIENGHLVNAGCLTGSGEWNVTPPDPYGLCIMDYEFIEYPHETKDWGSPKPYRKAIIYHGWAHEYFHRYQRAYHLDLNMGTQEVGTPAWWIEGAAIVFPNIWLKNNWQDFSAFRGLSFSQINVEGTDLNRWYRDVKRAAHGVSHQGDRCNGYVFGPAEERYETMRCFLGMANAYLAYLTSYQTLWVDIPMDIYELGFEKSFQKHTNMTLQEFYDQFNAFLSQGDPNDPPPAGFFPNGPISEYVNFPSP